MCVCVCVCKRARVEREKKEKRRARAFSRERGENTTRPRLINRFAREHKEPCEQVLCAYIRSLRIVA